MFPGYLFVVLFCTNQKATRTSMLSPLKAYVPHCMESLLVLAVTPRHHKDIVSLCVEGKGHFGLKVTVKYANMANWWIQESLFSCGVERKETSIMRLVCKGVKWISLDHVCFKSQRVWLTSLWNASESNSCHLCNANDATASDHMAATSWPAQLAIHAVCTSPNRCPGKTVFRISKEIMGITACYLCLEHLCTVPSTDENCAFHWKYRADSVFKHLQYICIVLS